MKRPNNVITKQMLSRSPWGNRRVDTSETNWKQKTVITGGGMKADRDAVQGI